jgi:hypothetical protein
VIADGNSPDIFVVPSTGAGLLESKIEAIPDNIKLETKFGNYEVSYELKNDQLYFKRFLSTTEGMFTKEDYEEFRKFREQIARNDNAKMVLLIK